MKYYGTLGPACETADILEKMIQTGMTGIRLNLSHKSLRESKVWIHEYFKAAGFYDRSDGSGIKNRRTAGRNDAGRPHKNRPGRRSGTGSR